jgi:UDP-N-acetylmuramate--alanine ligase
MNLNQIHNVYFIGIGGIGMSALARYFQYIGKNVAGYDKTETQLTSELQENGIKIHFMKQKTITTKMPLKKN